MRLLRLHLDGFGRWVDSAFEFAPGLNVFIGPNEAGKSTLQQAIVSLLFGFFEPHRRTADDVERVERYRPWFHPSYGGSLDYHLDCGGDFRIRRVIVAGQQHTLVVDLESGADISAAFPRDGLGTPELAAQHFGVSREVFTRVYQIDAKGSGPLSDVAYQVADTIGDAASAGRRDRNVTRAQQRLQQALADSVGSAGSHAGAPFADVGASAGGEHSQLAQADERLQELLIERTVVTLKYDSLRDDLSALAQHRRNLNAWTRERDELKYFLALSRSAALEQRVREVEKLDAAAAALREQLDKLQAVAQFPLHSRALVQRYAAQRQAHLERLARLEGTAQPSRAQVDELQMQVAKIHEQVRGLQAAREVPLEHEEAARALERTLPDTIRAFQESDAALNALRQALAALEPAARQAQQRPALLAAGPGRVHDLRLRWDALNYQLARAQRELAQVENAWRAQDFADTAFQALAQKAEDLTPATIDDLRAERQAAQQAEAAAARNWYARSLRPFAVAAFTYALIANTLLASTVLDKSTNWFTEGVAFLGGALFALLATLLLNVLVRRDRAALARSAQRLTRQARRRGFLSFEDMDSSYRRYWVARPLFEARQQAEQAYAESDAQRRALERELRQILETPVERELSAAQLADAEEQARQLARDLAEYERLEAERARVEQTWQAQRDAMQRSVEQARSILRASGMVELNLLSDLRAYLVMCDERRELEKVEQSQRELESALAARLEATLALEADVRAERTTMLSGVEELRLLLEQVGIGAEDVDAALVAYDQRHDQAERYQRLQALVQGLERERKALLHAQTLEQLQEQHAALVAESQSLLAQYPDWDAAVSERSDAALEAALGDVQQRISVAQGARAGIERRVHEGAAGYRSLAEVDEEIERTQERIRGLQHAGHALELALHSLADASEEYHRNFLPRLSSWLGAHLSALSDGHYQSVEVDRADLKVRVEAPALQAMVPPAFLGESVQAQVYLLLRFGLAELIGDGRESLPFLLDDPFESYDEARLRRALSLLLDSAARTQLLLFTKDKSVADWFVAQAPDATLHRLHTIA